VSDDLGVRRQAVLARRGDPAEDGSERVVRASLEGHSLAAVARVELVLEKIAQRGRHGQHRHGSPPHALRLAAAARSRPRRTMGLSPGPGACGAAATTALASARWLSASSTERRRASGLIPLAMASAASMVTPRRPACAAIAAISAYSARSRSAVSAEGAAAAA